MQIEKGVPANNVTWFTTLEYVLDFRPYAGFSSVRESLLLAYTVEKLCLGSLSPRWLY